MITFSSQRANLSKSLASVPALRVLRLDQGKDSSGQARGFRFHIDPVDFRRHFGAIAEDQKRVRPEADLREKHLFDSGFSKGDMAAAGISDGGEYRWITVHPNGKDEQGVPVRIRRMHDGAWGIINGAGGKLNGLRLTGVKSPEEYRKLAQERAKEKGAAQARQDAERIDVLRKEHRGEAEKIAAEQGIDTSTPEGAERVGQEASRLALEHRSQEMGDLDKSEEEVRKIQRDKEKDLISHIAAAQGWKEEDYTLSAADKQKLFDSQYNRVLQKNPKLGKAMSGDDVQKAMAAASRVHDLASVGVEKVESKHHGMVLRKAIEACSNHKEAILSAVDGLAADGMGDVGIGDLVKATFGDAGKGYDASLKAEAEARGMSTDVRQAADEVNWQSRLERKDFDAGAASLTTAAVVRMTEGAAKAREQLKKDMEKLGEGENSPLARLGKLETRPVVSTPAEAAKVLGTARVIEAGIKDAKVLLKQVKETPAWEALPKTAVLRAEDISEEEALKQVGSDLADTARERAVDSLLKRYDEESAGAPIRSHVLSGQSAFLSNVAATIGVRPLDPITIDVLGEHGAAQVLAHAVAARYGDNAAGMEGARSALSKHHVEGQIALCKTATAAAEERFQLARNSGVASAITDMDSMFEGLDANARSLALHSQGREILGLAVGRLQAAAALNEAMGRMGASGRNETLQVSLGPMSSKDAIIRANAIGLTDIDKRDSMTGSIIDHGDFDIHNDGLNKILTINGPGMAKLAAGLKESPEHLERAEKVSAIKEGKEDEEGWLPQGFSDRPASDVSAEWSPEVPKLDTQFNAGGIEAGPKARGELRDRIERCIARRIEAGHDPQNIGADMQAESFLDTHVPEDLQEDYRAAFADAVPPMKSPGKRPSAQDWSAYMAQRDRTMRGYHEAHVKSEAASMGLSGDDAAKFVALNSQTLPQTREAADLIHQVSIQDPRLRVAFKGLSDCNRADKRMLRDYAYQHILKGPNGTSLDPKDAETPIETLSDSERRAYGHWRDAVHTGDPYGAIQEQLQKNAGATMSMFGDDEDDADKDTQLAHVNLQDDAAVLKAATANAETLGYGLTHYGLDAKTGKAEGSYIPGLQPAPGETLDADDLKRAANKARDKIKAELRQRAASDLWGATGPDVRGKFDPDAIETASRRWGQYVGDMHGEERAYASIRDHMKGDFAARFAKGFKQRTGHEFRVGAVPVANAEAHAKASLDPDSRNEVERQRRGDLARAAQGATGKFVQGSAIEKDEAKKAGESLWQVDLFGDDEVAPPKDATSEKERIEFGGTHRVTLGTAAEATVSGMLPHLGLRGGTVAAADINMSQGQSVKRQRAIKLFETTKRMQMSLGVGSGKTSVAQGAFSDLKAQGKVKRAIMAVPSVVQEQFGSEAARFYDPTSKNFPKWVADSSLTANQRRAAYHHQSGNDIVVVTHQSLRDDLTWAVAKHDFDGDEEKAREFLANAPEAARNRSVRGACDREGWNFDMSVVDEGHNLLNRAGKANSAMANVLDAFTQDKPYHMAMSADPVKNDASEAFDLLRKVAPHRYVNDPERKLKVTAGTDIDGKVIEGGDDDSEEESGVKPSLVTRSEFLRRYGANTLAAKESLAREMAPYHYAESLPPDVEANHRTHEIDMTPPQRAAYSKVLATYQRARNARRNGVTDIEAVKELSPNGFKGQPESEHEAIAQNLLGALGPLRDAALDRVVNEHPEGAKLDWLDHTLGLRHSKTHGEKGVRSVGARDEPTIIFANHLNAVDTIAERLKSRGVRVAQIDGRMSGEEKDAQKRAFSPQWDDARGDYVTAPTADVIVCSDAAAVGWNGQRAARVINWDTPHTAMLREQRHGRSVRTGQRNAKVHLDTVMTDTKYEHTRRDRIEKKGALREAMTTPAELIDDSGLAGRIARETDAARDRLVTTEASAKSARKGRKKNS